MDEVAKQFKANASSGELIEALTRVLQERKGADASSSYVASLYQKGLPKILAKIEEEAAEVLEAATEGNSAEARAHLVHEVADLWFHTLVLLVNEDIDPGAVLGELERRFGISGHVEKASRPATLEST